MLNTALLLTDPSPCLRLLVLTYLLNKASNSGEVKELRELREQDYLVRDIRALQEKNGAWSRDAIRGTAGSGRVQTTAFVLKRLGYIGFPPDYPVIEKAASFVFSCQQKTGAWSPAKDGEDENAGAEATLIYTALILQGLALSGYGETEQAKKAYTWLSSFRLPDGAWPAGMVKGNYRGIAGYRRLAHSRFGCRSTTTAVAAAFAYHPVLSRTSEAKRALDMILSTELREAGATGYEVARLTGAEQVKGLLTHYARYDCAFILDLCRRTGIDTDDERVSDIIRFLLEQQGPYGLWEYNPNPGASRWITFDILRSLSYIDAKTDWLSLEPRTPFRKYPSKQKRF
ncbi:MAG: terpene cyclase/mutase family protein [Spirochaetales bacterium]|nr:terpene cyclase/mutase family protein [Spirochaetales bacterium]